MHGIYNYIPETNHICRVYSTAAILYGTYNVTSHVFVYHASQMHRIT
jgi:hypothetical protein